MSEKIKRYEILGAVTVTLEIDKEGVLWVFLGSKLPEAVPAGTRVRLGVFAAELFAFLKKNLKKEVSYVA